MVRGWWSAISIILPWSGVGSQLLTSSSHDLGWWSAINIIELWSGVYFVPQSTTLCGTGLLHTTKYYSSTPYYKGLLQYTPRRSRESSPGPPASKANALCARQIFWDDHIRKIVMIANTMRGAIVQIQNANVHTPRTMRGAIPRAQIFAFRHSFARSTHRIRREGSSGKIKLRVSLQRRAFQNFKMNVSLQRRAQKCMKRAHGVGGRPRHTKIIVLPQFRTSDQHEVTKGLPRRRKNLHFTTVLGVR